MMISEVAYFLGHPVGLCTKNITSQATLLANERVWQRYCPNSTWLVSTRHDSTRSTLSSQSSESRRACQASRAVLLQHGGRRTSDSARLYKFSCFYALVYTNPICFVK